MRIIISLFICILYLQIINAQMITEQLTNIIQTTVHVDTLVSPDAIFLEIQTKQKDYKKELDEIEEIIINKLQAIGIDTKTQLKIDDFNSVYSSRLLFGNSIKQTRTYELIISTAGEAIMVIDQLNEEEIGYIRLTKTEYSNEDSLMLELRKKAMIKAKKQALSMSGALGQQIGKALIISDVNPVSNSQRHNREEIDRYLFQQYSKQKNNLKNTILEMKKIQYNQDINVTFELK